MAKKRISRAFKDISLSFTPHPITKDLTILKNENAIARSVRNLVDLNEFEVTVIFDIVGQEIPTQDFTFILEATR